MFRKPSDRTAAVSFQNTDFSSRQTSFFHDPTFRAFWRGSVSVDASHNDDKSND